MSVTDCLVPYRCVGQVFGRVPAAYRTVDRSGNLGFLTVPVKNCLLNYAVRPFRLVWSSDHFKSEIRAVVRTQKRIFAALEDRVEVVDHTGRWRRTILEGTAVKFMVAMGQVLVVVDDGDRILVVNTVDEEITAEFDCSGGNFKVSALIHPDTYFNKVSLSFDMLSRRFRMLL